MKTEARCLKVKEAGELTTMQVVTLRPGEDGRRCSVCPAALGHLALACIHVTDPEVIAQIAKQIPEELRQDHPNFPRETGKGDKLVSQGDYAKFRSQINCTPTIFPLKK